MSETARASSAASGHPPAEQEGQTTAPLLYAAAAELLELREPAAVLSTSVRLARELLSTDLAFVMLLDPSGERLKLQASIGHRTPTFTTIVRPVHALTAVGTGGPVQSADFLNDSGLDHDPPTDDIVRKEGMRTVLAVPLRSGERMLGALYVGNRFARHFPAQEVDALCRLAGHVAQALERTQALGELASALKEATRRARDAEAQGLLLARAEEIRRAVAAEVQVREGITTVAVTLADQLRVPVMVTDWRLELLVEAPGGAAADVRPWPAAPLDHAQVRDAVAASTRSHRPASVGRRLVVAPIEAGRTLLGYLWAGLSVPVSQSRLIELVIERVTPLAAVELLSEGDSERRQQGDFIYQLLSDRLPDFSVLEARAPQLWARHGSAHRPAVLEVAVGDDQPASALEVARRLVAAARPQDFTALYGRRLIVLITPAERSYVEIAVSEMLGLLGRNGLIATAAVGAPCGDLRESRESILATLRVQELVSHPDILWVEGLEALAQLFDPSQRDRLESFCRTALAPLSDRPALMDTLNAYYEVGANKAVAARRLSIHVNTLRQRLERAQELVGGSIDDSTRAVPLRLALLVRQVTGVVRSAHSPPRNM